MDDRSERNLAGLHRDLIAVARASLQLPQPFVIDVGLRTTAQQAALYAQGRTAPGPVVTQKDGIVHRSDHQAHGDGTGHAFDVAALIDGKANFAPGREAEIFGLIASQILGAAARLNVPMQWGGQAVGAWVDGRVSHFRDYAHFQLDRSRYP